MLLNLEEEIRTALVFTSVALLIYLFRTDKKIKKLPPGPFSWPIIGNFLEFASNTHVKLAKLKTRYGDICSGKAGSMNFVILNSVNAVKEAYNKSEFLGKPPYHGFTTFADKSVFFSNDLDLWREQRGFVVRSMRDFGLGKVKIEDEIEDEIRCFLEFLEKQHKAPIHFERILERSVANNILTMVVGKRYTYEDPVLIAMIQSIKEYKKNVARSGIYLTFPWVKYLSPFLKWLSNRYVFDGYDQTKINFREIIKEHKETFNEKNIRNFVDSYLQEIYKKGSNSNFTEDILLLTSMEFIGAGTETTSCCIMWCIYTIAANPDIKGKIIKEIDDVIGFIRLPSVSDQKLMPYVQAFIFEVIRWASIVPIAPLRYTLRDTTLGGYDIPKDTAVLANFWGVHHDPEVWDEPHIIKPERFLEPDGNVTMLSNYIQFSTGKRKCPGEAMAYMEIFLYVVSILQRFDINFLPGEKPTFESEIMVLSRPKNFPIYMTSRTNSLNITLT